MTNKSLIFAGIFAAITTSSFATGENTVTSKSYVDAQDALKQDKITAKTSGNVVTYNGTDKNGQARFDERGIFDPSTGWDDQNEQLVEGHEDDLITAGDVIPVVNIMYNQMDAMRGDANTVVVRNEYGAPVSSRDIYDGSTTYNASNDADSLITAGAVQGQIDASVTNQITNVNNEITNINNQLNAQTLTPVTVQLPLTCANENDGCTLWQIGGTDVAHKLTSCTTATVATDCPACGTGTKKACVDSICKCNACKVDGMTAANSAECCSGVLNNNQCCGTPGGVICPSR